MAEVTSGDVTVIVLSRREADWLADCIEGLVFADEVGGGPVGAELWALAEGLGVR